MRNYFTVPLKIDLLSAEIGILFGYRTWKLPVNTNERTKMHTTCTVKVNYLPLNWSVSRGRDTYGYNICRLDDNDASNRYKCTGGGYDMVGTCIGDWLQDVYQDRLIALVLTNPLIECGYTVAGYWKIDGLYGATFKIDKETSEVICTLDGGCGLSSMQAIAETIGVRVTSNYNRRGNRTDGFFVTDYGNAQNLKENE